MHDFITNVKSKGKKPEELKDVYISLSALIKVWRLMDLR